MAIFGLSLMVLSDFEGYRTSFWSKSVDQVSSLDDRSRNSQGCGLEKGNIPTDLSS